MPAGPLRAPAALAPAVEPAAHRRQARRQRRPLAGAYLLGSTRSPTRRFPLWSSREAGPWPMRSAPASQRLGFGDAAAHRMALLAMDQLAWAIAGLRQGFTVGATEAELRDALERGQRRGLGALCLDRRTHRHRGILAAHLRQSGALAQQPARRRALLSDQVDRAPQGAPAQRAPARARRRRGRGLCRHAGGDRHAHDSAWPRRPCSLSWLPPQRAIPAAPRSLKPTKHSEFVVMLSPFARQAG